MDIPHNQLAFLELFQRGPAINRRDANTGGNLLFQPANTLHEEFIEVAADDGEELDAFQQGGAVIRGHVQYTAIEFQPGQFPVKVQLGVIQIDCLWLLCPRRPCRRLAGSGGAGG